MMRESSTERPPMSTMVLGYIVFNAISLAIYAASIGMLLGIFWYPRTLGLYAVFPYLTYTLVLRRDELKDGAHSLQFSRHGALTNLMRRFLQIQISLPLPDELVQADQKPNAQFIIAGFPHAANADFRSPMDGILHEAFPHTADRVRTLAASAIFRIPIVRELGLWTGCVDARRRVAEACLDRGRSLVILPGGTAEQLRTTHGQEIVYLQNRKGFVKLALQKNVPIVPLYAFGASDYYYTSHAFYGTREWIQKKFGACIPLAMGFWGSLLSPRPVKTILVFGKPILFACKTEGLPTAKEVDVAHARFCAELQKLFETHKNAAGYGDRSLQIV